jgi:O-antigen/teichoic acid export membrane protein
LFNLSQNKTVRQTLLLFVAQIFGLVIGFISNMLLAKQMGSYNFGVYSFALAVISFAAIFYEFGYFASVSRLLAQNREKQKERQLVGAALVILGVISTLFYFSILLVSFFIDNLFADKVGNILRITSAVSWSFIIPFYMELVLKGSNHVEFLSFFNVLWKILFVATLFVLHYSGLLTPLNVLYALSTSCIVSFFYYTIKLNPSFENLKRHLQDIQKENMSFGRHLYSGRVIDSATYQLDRLLIGYFMGVKDVGLYSLAGTMANPIASFSTALATSKYKIFSDGKPISSRVLKTNLAWIAVAVLGANTLGYIIIGFYLGSEYRNMFLILILMTVAVGFQAGYQLHNAWLGSNGEGKYLKQKAVYTAALNLALNFTLIPLYGAVGAAIASLTSMAFSYLLHVYYYNLGLSRSK